MNRSRKTISVVLLIYMLSATAFGQQRVIADQRIIWKSRADTITYNLVKEASKAEPLERAVIYSQLADLWWKFDADQSDSWFEKAVDTLVYKTDENSKHETYFRTVNEILKIISSRSQKQTDRLIKLLSEADKVPDKDKNANADALIEFALSIVKENPVRATELGSLSFKIGQPNDYYKLYWELRRYAPSLADKFFKTAFSSAAVSLNPQTVSNLKSAVFPETFLPNAPTAILSPNSIKVETLNFFADYIIQQQAKFSGKSITSCEPEAFSIAPLKNQFNTLLPQKTDIVEQAVGICLSSKSRANRDLTTTGINIANKRDVDEILKLADEAKDDPKVRAYYLLRAASLANEQEKYKTATEILENMTKEERENDFGFWEELRYTVASGLAYEQFQEQDLAGAVRTLEAVPADNRAFAKVGFALKFSHKDVSAREFILERIRDARSDFAKSEKSFAEKSDYWFQIVKLYSNYSMTTEAAETFKEIVKNFNKSLSDDKVKAKPSIKSGTTTSIISADLLEAQDNSLFESAGLIEDEDSRVQVNLGFLKTTLKKYESLNAKEIKTSNKSVNLNH